MDFIRERKKFLSVSFFFEGYIYFVFELESMQGRTKENEDPLLL